MDLILMFAAICNIVKFVVETAKSIKQVYREKKMKTTKRPGTKPGPNVGCFTRMLMN